MSAGFTLACWAIFLGVFHEGSGWYVYVFPALAILVAILRSVTTVVRRRHA